VTEHFETNFASEYGIYKKVIGVLMNSWEAATQ